MKRFIVVLMTVACLAGACTQAAAFEIPEAWIDQYRTEETFPADIAAEYYIQDGVLFFNDVWWHIRKAKQTANMPCRKEFDILASTLLCIIVLSKGLRCQTA